MIRITTTLLAIVGATRPPIQYRYSYYVHVDIGYAYVRTAGTCSSLWRRL